MTKKIKNTEDLLPILDRIIMLEIAVEDIRRNLVHLNATVLKLQSQGGNFQPFQIGFL